MKLLQKLGTYRGRCCCWPGLSMAVVTSAQADTVVAGVKL